MAEKIKCDCGITFEVEEGQTHCNHCGKKLSDIGKGQISESQKKKIEEEEYRDSVRKDLGKNKKGKGCLIAIGLLIGFFILIAAISGGGKKEKATQPTNPQQQTEADIKKQQQDEEARKKQAQEISDSFCTARSKPYIRYVNLTDFIEMYEKAGETVTLRPVINVKPSLENCKKVIDICLKLWKMEECRDIAEQKIWIGMTNDQLILSWGLPNDRNNTVGSWGINTQWVYGDFGPYVYLEGESKDDLVVTSWQD
jgi:hypothetical protein